MTELGAVNTKTARDEDLAAEIADVTGLTERTVRKRLKEAHGRTLVRNLFDDRWPSEPVDFEGKTAAWARRHGLSSEIARITGLTPRTVAKKLADTNGKTHVATVFADLWGAPSATKPAPALGETLPPASDGATSRSEPPSEPPPWRSAAGRPGAKMALRRFALHAAGGYRGKGAGETFARGLLAAFGTDPDGEVEGLRFGHGVDVVDRGKRTSRTVSMYWEPRRVVLDVVDRDAVLDAAWGELVRVCLQMPAEPQYVVLTNQRDVRLYDLARDRGAPRLTLALDELPKHSEAFPFLGPDWAPGQTPKIINDAKVSKEVADLVAKVYRALRAEHPERVADVTRFTLQCIVAMFAEDIGLLPKEYFTTLLYRAAEDGDARERLAELFRQMASEEANEAGVPYFNGGLFTDPVTLALEGAPLRALTRASESDWTHVDPHIFGSVFQGIMDDDERHASGAHYTAREDIMSVVGPTIVEPWRERISAASTLSDLQALLADLAKFRVLDPACGSGNFLYVAFRELYKLETEVLVRAYEYASVQKGQRVGWASGIRTTSFFGIDINPFAVELAKTTLNIAKKIAHDERRATVVELFGQDLLDTDPSLPLDNLDENIRCADALFTEWPEVDAIIGNPPFLGDRKIRSELGEEYLAKLRARFPQVTGVVEYCAHWFRLAHERLPAGGRAGLIGTSAIRMGKARAASLDTIVDRGGRITNAVSSMVWPGESALNVCIVNWVNKPEILDVNATLVVDGQPILLPEISSHLRLTPNVRAACDLGNWSDSTSMGIIFGIRDFEVPPSRISHPMPAGWVKPIATGNDLLRGVLGTNPRLCVDMRLVATEEQASEAGWAFDYLLEHVRPEVLRKATKYKGWDSRWWQPWRPRHSFAGAMGGRHRIVACSSPQSRPVFVFLSSEFVPTNTLQLFAFDDDYTFGIIQSSLHWAWTKAKGGRVTERIRYTSGVWKTFPWPQEPTEDEVAAVGQAAQRLRATRRELMQLNGWSLRDLYRSAEVEGAHPLKDAQAALDAAVEAAYQKPAHQEATEFLLEMNLALAEDEAAGHAIQGPGLPMVDGRALDPRDTRWFSTDCIEPPPLPDSDEA